jgi:hypothetical protein
MRAQEIIAEVEAILPGEAATDGQVDARWQGMLRIEDCIQEEPDAVWKFILRWGCHEDADLRAAVATLLLEHLLACHFNTFFPKVATAVQNNVLFGDTFTRCWKVGQSKEEANAALFDDLLKTVRVTKRHDS